LFVDILAGAGAPLKPPLGQNELELSGPSSGNHNFKQRPLKTDQSVPWAFSRQR
jgi:hypothetical protein